MSDVNEFLNRVVKRSALRRESFAEKNLPTEASNVVVLPLFGDLRSIAETSALVLRPWMEANRDKYVIVCSWPGMKSLFPTAHEFWTLRDRSALQTMASNASGSSNASVVHSDMVKSLLEATNVVTQKEFDRYYFNGFGAGYAELGEPKLWLPEVPSESKLAPSFIARLAKRPGKKIVVYPSKRLYSRQQGKTISLPVAVECWNALVENLLEAGYDPVVYQNLFTYDLSTEFVERCIYLVAEEMTDVFAGFRHIGCVLDVHSGISRMALLARCPFVCATERRIYVDDRDFEFDDLCGPFVPKSYAHVFSTQLMTGGVDEWQSNLFDLLKVRVAELPPAPELSPKEWYGAAPVGCVRNMTAKRLGLNFLRKT